VDVLCFEKEGEFGVGFVLCFACGAEGRICQPWILEFEQCRLWCSLRKCTLQAATLVHAPPLNGPRVLKIAGNVLPNGRLNDFASTPFPTFQNFVSPYNYR
jgi:hypothetical protein